MTGWEADLRRITAFLADGPRTIQPAAAAALRDRAAVLTERLRLAEDRVVVGLVGGTGVGKSTLINALAGAEISAASDRRPTTERAVLYRHRERVCDAGLAPEDRSEADTIHEVEDLRHVVIVDFPDFDGREAHHARLVARALPYLDLLVVVADLEKYADQALYAFLDGLPQARANQLFVLNKTDRLARLGIGAEDAIQILTADFAAKLRQHAGRARPDIYPLSALEALRAKRAGALAPQPWQAFEARMRALREAKRRRRIRRENLAEGVRRLAAALWEAADPDARAPAVAALRERLEPARAAWHRLAGEVARAPFGEGFRHTFQASVLDEAIRDWGPAACPLARALARVPRGPIAPPRVSPELLADASARFRRRLDFARGRVVEALRRTLPGARIDPGGIRLELAPRAEAVGAWLDREREGIARRFRRGWPNLVLPALGLLVGVAAAAHPAAADLLARARAGDLTGADVFWGLLGAILHVFEPVTLAGTALVVAGAFALGVLRRTGGIRTRARRAIEGCAERLARALREAVDREIEALEGELAAAASELERLSAAFRREGAGGSRGAPREAPRSAG